VHHSNVVHSDRQALPKETSSHCRRRKDKFFFFLAMIASELGVTQERAWLLCCSALLIVAKVLQHSGDTLTLLTIDERCMFFLFFVV
jgi:hypothetical protein